MPFALVCTRSPFRKRLEKLRAEEIDDSRRTSERCPPCVRGEQFGNLGNGQVNVLLAQPYDVLRALVEDRHTVVEKLSIGAELPYTGVPVRPEIGQLSGCRIHTQDPSVGEDPESEARENTERPLSGHKDARGEFIIVRSEGAREQAEATLLRRLGDLLFD